jgi:hypothetical protein
LERDPLAAPGKRLHVEKPSAQHGSGSSDQTDSAAFLDFGSVQVLGGDDHGNGNGIDTAVYSGPSSNYTVIVGPDSVKVQDNVGNDGTDTLFGVEHLQFSNQTLDTTWFSKEATLRYRWSVSRIRLGRVWA